MDKGSLVSPLPHCGTHQLQPRDQFLIIASDGLWDVISDKSAGEIVAATMSSIGTGSKPCWRPNEASATKAAERLVEAALKAGSRDNITVVVIAMHWDQC